MSNFDKSPKRSGEPRAFETRVEGTYQNLFLEVRFYEVSRLLDLFTKKGVQLSGLPWGIFLNRKISGFVRFPSLH
jgi:hypothetical protein